MTGKVHVEMVMVVTVSVWSEHGRELLAGAAMDSPKERLFVGVSTPAVFDGDFVSVYERERRNVEGIGAAVL